MRDGVTHVTGQLHLMSFTKHPCSAVHYSHVQPLRYSFIYSCTGFSLDLCVHMFIYILYKVIISH